MNPRPHIKLPLHMRLFFASVVFLFLMFAFVTLTLVALTSPRPTQFPDIILTQPKLRP